MNPAADGRQSVTVIPAVLVDNVDSDNEAEPDAQKSARETTLSESISEEEQPPPLPPRPGNAYSTERRPSNFLGSLQRPSKSSRPQLQSRSTIAVSLTDIHAQSFQDGSPETYASVSKKTHHQRSPGIKHSFERHQNHNGSDADESGSLKSYVPTIEASGDVESLLGDVLGSGEESPAWKLSGGHDEISDPFDLPEEDEAETGFDFASEFNELDAVNESGDNEGITISMKDGTLR